MRKFEDENDFECKFGCQATKRGGPTKQRELLVKERYELACKSSVTKQDANRLSNLRFASIHLDSERNGEKTDRDRSLKVVAGAAAYLNEYN